MRFLLTLVAAGILGAPSTFAQYIRGKIYPEKQIYLLGEPLIAVLDIESIGTSPIQIGDSPCLETTRFEVPDASRPRRISLYGCESGLAVSCLGGIVRLQAGQHDLRRILVSAGPFDYFKFDLPGSYHIHASTSVTVYADRSAGESEELGKIEVESDFNVILVRATESELRQAFDPYLQGLKSTNVEARALAVAAVTQYPQDFFQDVLVGLADDSLERSAGIAGLENLGTAGAKERLAQLSGAGNDEAVRQKAIQALGELDDPAYCPLMLDMAKRDPQYSGTIAARAAGALCGEKALPTLLTLLAQVKPNMRPEIAHAVGNTQSRGAVTPLISLLLDRNVELRIAATQALAALTHRRSAHDVNSEESALQAYREWTGWWGLNAQRAAIYGVKDCTQPEPLN